MKILFPFHNSIIYMIYMTIHFVSILQDQMDNASCDDVVMMEESPVSNCPVCCQPLPLSQHELVLLKYT